MRCPVCKLATGIYYRPPEQISDKLTNLVRADLLDPAALATVPQDIPLYQRSYKSEPEYISPRCLACYVRAERSLLKKLAKKEVKDNAADRQISTSLKTSEGA